MSLYKTTRRLEVKAASFFVLLMSELVAKQTEVSDGTELQAEVRAFKSRESHRKNTNYSSTVRTVVWFMQDWVVQLRIPH